MLDLDIVYEPEAEEIEAHAIAFAQMMFAHSELERRVGDLQDVIVHQRGFGERPSNQWGARKRPEAHRFADQRTPRRQRSGGGGDQETLTRSHCAL